ncbi:MAG: ABC transporter ATP-binding protein [Candidatus Eiseniibacteriota bacterium]|jgi:ABC-2 type transport system ATP-binding protein
MIDVQGVTKCFGRLAAVADVSFRVERDEIVGFVGPNGAGKSTMLRMLATYLRPTRGAIHVAGFDTVGASLAVRRRVGYLAGDTPLYPRMRVDDFVRFVARARGLRGQQLERQLVRVVDLAGIAPVLDRRIAECSTGFRQRIGFASALVHDPPILVLDEPTHGFDPLQVLAFRDLLRELRDGRAILFSSHIIQEVQAISDRVLIIHEGRLLGDGTLPELAGQTGVDSGDLEEIFARLVRARASGDEVARV